MAERRDPDSFTRFQTRERCAWEIAAYVFKTQYQGRITSRKRTNIISCQFGQTIRYIQLIVIWQTSSPHLPSWQIESVKWFEH